MSRLHRLAGALLLGAAAAASAGTPFEDTIGQRMLACTGCHGVQGRAAADGYYPRIAGKPAGYLFNQLRAFRDGRRHYELMNALLSPLDDAYLREIAAHFASLSVPYAAPVPPAEPADVLKVGESLVRNGDPGRGLPACAACHGAAMTGRQPAIPGLLGLPRDYVNAQLGAWRNGKRQADAPDCMARVATLLRPDEVGAVSAWLAAQPVPTPATAPVDATPLPIACGGGSGTTATPTAPGRLPLR